MSSDFDENVGDRGAIGMLSQVLYLNPRKGRLIHSSMYGLGRAATIPDLWDARSYDRAVS